MIRIRPNDTVTFGDAVAHASHKERELVLEEHRIKSAKEALGSLSLLAKALREATVSTERNKPGVYNGRCSEQ